jgi:hypothetical protein
MYLKPGDTTDPFHKAESAIGNIILRFDSFDEMHEKIRSNAAILFPRI